MTTPPTTTPWVPMWPLDAAAPPAGGGIPADVVIPSGQNLIRNRFLEADTQAAFQIASHGSIQWGPGGTAAPDMALYRASGGVLKASVDIFSASSHIVVGNDVAASRLWFGAAFDTSIYSPYGGALLAQARFDSTDVIAANAGGDGSATVTIGYSLGVKMAGISFGLHDTNLYRFSAGTLKTDGAFLTGLYAVVNYGHATDQLIIGDVSDWMGAPANRPGIIFGTASDAALAYDAPGILRCTGHLRVTGQMNVWGGYIDMMTDSATIRFGAAIDTNLYRSAAGTLATDGILTIGGSTHGHAFYGEFFYNNGVFQHVYPTVGWAFIASLTGDADQRFLMYSDGRMTWGDGTNTQDVSLQRNGPGSLYSPNTLAAGILRSQSYVIANDNAVAPIVGLGYSFQAGAQICGVGFTSDTTLARLSPGVLGINGVAISTGGTRSLLKVRRNANTAVGPGRIQWESADTDNYGGWSSGYREAVFLAGAGVYKITVQGYFSGGSGDGDQGIWVTRLGTGAVVVEDVQITWQHSANNGWNRWQCGSVTMTAVAGDALVARCDGGATGTPGNCQATCMTVEKIA